MSEKVLNKTSVVELWTLHDKPYERIKKVVNETQDHKRTCNKDKEVRGVVKVRAHSEMWHAFTKIHRVCTKARPVPTVQDVCEKYLHGLTADKRVQKSV